MSIHVPRRGTKRSWALIWGLIVLSVAAVATGCFGLQPTPKAQPF